MRHADIRARLHETSASRSRSWRSWPRIPWTWFIVLLGATALHLGGAAAEMSPGTQARDVRLYLIEDPGCPYCARWTAEVQPGYLKSPEGAFALLVRRYRGDPEVARFERVNYSPTFILVRGDEEIGRITGYMGADLFWTQLDELMKKAGYKAAH